MKLDEINDVLPAAGEAAILLAVVFVTIDIPCNKWFGWAISCPPSLWQVIPIVTFIFVFFVWVFWFVFHRKGNV